MGDSMGWVFTCAIILIFSGCLLLLNISIGPSQFVPAQEQAILATSPTTVVSSNVVQIVTSSLLFIISYGVLKLAVGYFSFASNARQISSKAAKLLEDGCTDIVAAIKLWQDYHLVRATSPMLPRWIWALREKKLNILYSAYFSAEN